MTIRLPLLLLALATLASCGPASMVFRQPETNNGVSAQGSPVCTPPTGGGSSQNGLSGQLYYLDPNSTPLNSVDDYIATGHLSPSTFFFNQLNLPTEVFSQGFAMQNGAALTDPSGNILIENFALDLKSTVSLASGDQPGDYQFALLSDDGSVLESVDSAGNDTVLVNNDGLHTTRFGCGTSVVNFTSSTKLNIRLKYYQGPRYYIALSLLWKKIPAGTTKLDMTYCGDSGNTLFFDPSVTPSIPQPEYNNLLKSGWVPLRTQNYTLPTGTTNPCVN